MNSPTVTRRPVRRTQAMSPEMLRFIRMDQGGSFAGLSITRRPSTVSRVVSALRRRIG